MKKYLLSAIQNKSHRVMHKSVDFGGGRVRDMLVVEGFAHMIRDSVMNRVYYPAETFDVLAKELSASQVEVHAPAGHPEDKDGNFVSAKEPRSLAYNIGAYHFNWRVEGDRLISDLAIDPERAQNSNDGKEILHKINHQDYVDGSTAFYVDLKPKKGVGPDGEEYDTVASNLFLDHSAILIGEPGAKTNAEGVGIFANREGRQKIDVINIEINRQAANLNLPLVGSEHKWDESAAIKRLREFTDSEKVPSSNYRKFFAYFDSDKPDDFDSYKFPFADIIDGRPKAVPNALKNIDSELNSTDIGETCKSDAKKVVEWYQNGGKARNNSGILSAVKTILQFAGFGGYNLDSGISATDLNTTEVSNNMGMKDKLKSMMKKYSSNMTDDEKAKMNEMSEEDMLNMIEKYAGGSKKNEDEDGEEKEKEKKKNSAEESEPGDDTGTPEDETTKKLAALLAPVSNSIKTLTEKMDKMEKQVNSGDAERRKELLKFLPAVNADMAAKLETDELEKLAAANGFIAVNAAGSVGSPPNGATGWDDMKMPNSGGES